MGARENWISQTALAQSRGVSKQYISKLVKRGIITPREDGKLERRSANRAIDDAMTPAVELMREHNASQRGKAKKPGKNPVSQKAAKRAKTNGHAHPSPLLVARAAREQALATREQLELDRELGKVVLISEVVEQVGRDFNAVRSRLRAVPSEIAPALARLKTPAEIEARLRDHIDRALEQLTADEDIQAREAGL